MMCSLSLSSCTTSSAKWEQSLNVYKRDNQNIVCIFYRLIDAHQAPVAQDAMKVNLATQVMSHTVEASLNSVATQGNEQCSAFIVL